MSKNFLLRLSASITLAPLILLAVYLNGLFFNFILILILILSLSEILKLRLIRYKIFLIILLIIFSISLFNLRNLEFGNLYCFLLILITWLSDIGGYIFGKIFKGKKINIISPNKTYIGFLGSVIFVQPLIFLISYYKVPIFNDFYRDLFFLFFSSVVVIFGDLYFSYIKRKCEIKDFSNIIPGHGGMLDRIDGFIFLIIVFNIFVYIK
jgi:phosphatidate cytidylyltransferase